MNSKLRERVIQTRQKNAIKEALVQIDGDLEIAQQILHPESGEIAIRIQHRSESRSESESTTTRYVTRDLVEVNNSFAAYLASYSGSGEFLCVLPGLSIADENALTRFPVLKTDARGIQKLYSHFSSQDEFDFFGLLCIQSKAFWIVSAHADYPNASNNFFDGPEYTVSTGLWVGSV
ncbi:MAG: hypothetical protein JRC77_05960 [Deltaproteobacteria bacterium]|nr:hypothetical protein [Deltaproteobacteria bacterium]